MTVILGRDIRTCRGCGCDDNRACQQQQHDGTPFIGPCWWVLTDVFIDDDRAAPAPTGVCSSCAEMYDYHPLALAALGSRDPGEALLRAAAFATIAPALFEDEKQIPASVTVIDAETGKASEFLLRLLRSRLSSFQARSDRPWMD